MATRKKGHDIDWSQVPRRGSGPASVPPPASLPEQATAVRPPAAPAPAPKAAPRPRTGPGYNALQIFTGNALQERIAELEQEVQRIAAERGAVALAPGLVVPSRWANRHEASFRGPAFEALRTEIRDAGGNVQPIMVRPLPVPREDGARYEVVFGHRRHRACLEAGLPVLAVVKEVDDRTLFDLMERENRVRQNLSAYEQGLMYRRALDEGLFPSLRQLAAQVGRSHGDLSKALRIAMLPPEVVAAFRSPNDLQFRWAAALGEAVVHNASAVLRAAADPALKTLTPRRVFQALVDAGGGPSTTPAASARSRPAVSAPGRFELGPGRTLAIRHEGGRTVLELDGRLPPELWQRVAASLGKLVVDRPPPARETGPGRRGGPSTTPAPDQA